MKLFVAVALTALAAMPGMDARQLRRELPSQPTPQFRSSVDLVHLDVSVLDRNRRPVRGLRPADFTVLEDGKPQSVSVFQAVDIPDPTPPSTPWMRDVAPDVGTNTGLQERRLFLIVIDDAMLQLSLHALKSIRDIGRRVIDKLGPSDLAAVVFTRDNRNSQDYTTDRARLLAAIDKVSIGFRGMGGPDDLYLMYSVDVLARAVDILTTLPDRRKSVIYVGQGVPVDFEMVSATSVPGLPINGGASAISTASQMIRLKDQMTDLFRRAARANVNVYTVDACGLRAPPYPPGPCTSDKAGSLELDYLQIVASNTGGRAVVNTNDFEPGVAAIFEENASYYLLGYQSTNSKQDGRIRRLEVRVNRPGVEVRTRSGYEAEKAKDVARRKAALAASPLGAALAGILPKSDVPLTISAVPFPLPGRREAAVAITVGVRQPLREGGGRTTERVDLQVSAFDVDGRSFGTTRLRADVTIRAGATGLADYEVFSRIDLKPGRYQLRIATHVGGLATSGSIYHDVDVPDFTAKPVSLSGMVLTATPGPPVAPRNAFKGVLPILPTTRRQFGSGDQVAAFLQVYLGGKGPLTAVPLRVQLQGQSGPPLMDRRQDVAADRFDKARTANIVVELPAAQMPAGEYLLTIEHGSGAAVTRRQIRFTVASDGRKNQDARGVVSVCHRGRRGAARARRGTAARPS